MADLTIVIHTRNCGKDIENCIKSAKLLSEKICVIDMESSDRTVSIAKGMGAEVYNFPYSRIVEPARSFGINSAKTDWVFLLDCDERITAELAAEIKKEITDKAFSHYKVPRKEIVLGKFWLKHGNWWPNRQTRLINRRYFVDWPAAIHSTPKIEGSMGILENCLLHYSQNDFSDIVNKTLVFEDMEAELLYKANRKVTTATFFRKFFAELYRRLLKGFGFADGNVGIIESIYQAFSKTITYLFLYEKKKDRPV